MVRSQLQRNQCVLTVKQTFFSFATKVAEGQGLQIDECVSVSLLSLLR